MGPLEVVVGGPGLQMLVSFIGVFPVFGVGPFAKQGLDETFGLAVGTRRIGAGTLVFDFKFAAGGSKLVGAIGASIVGEQGADLDAVALIEGEGVVQKADSGFGLLIGKHLGKGKARVVVDGHVQGLETGMLG